MSNFYLSFLKSLLNIYKKCQNNGLHEAPKSKEILKNLIENLEKEIDLDGKIE